MAKNIKTRNTVKGIKVLDKSVSASKRMKEAYVQTKDSAEETKNPRHATPTEYASENTQDTARSVALDVAHGIPNIRHKASENLNRAKGHFQEVKRHMPKERQQAATQAQNTAQTTKTNAIKLRKEADHAFTQAQEAKAAVKDSKTALKEVRQTGRQTMREVKLDAAQKMKMVRGDKLPDQPLNPIKTRNSVNPLNTTPNAPKINAGRPISGASSVAERGISPTMELSKKPLISGRQFQLSNLNPFRRKATPPKATDTKAAAPVSKPKTAPSDNPIKNSVSRPSYTNATPKGADKAAQSLQSTAKSIKSTKKGFKDTAKGTVKTAKKSVKTAEKTAKKAVKTAQQTAKTAQKTAKAAIKTAKTAERAARAAAKVAAQTAKIAAKAVTAMVKAAIAAVKGLVSAIIAGGWIAVLVILIICMIGLLVGSVYGIFFSGEDNGTSRTMPSVVAELTADFYEQVERIKDANPHDVLDMDAMSIYWPEVLAVYAVKVSTALDGMDVATLDDERVEKLRAVLNDMVTLSYTLRTDTWEHTVINDEGEEVTEIETITTLVITMTQKSIEDMAAQYGFSNNQKTQLYELLSPEYADLWARLLGGYVAGDGTILTGSGSYIPKDIFSWPLESIYPITSQFGYRKDPFTGETKYHSGTDFGAPRGTPILAAADGTVIVANSTDSQGGGYGYYVKIQHTGGYATLYAHCSQIAVTNGQEVRKGQVIAYVGSTGRSTGNHLHWEVYKDGVRTNPLDYFE